MVIRIPAPLTASAGLAATVAPSSARAAAWLAVRSHARTSKPARARLAAIGPPVRPVPRNAITRVPERLWFLFGPNGRTASCVVMTLPSGVGPASDGTELHARQGERASPGRVNP